MRLAFVSTYPPRRCGIATYTAALVGSLSAHTDLALEVVPVLGHGDPRDPQQASLDADRIESYAACSSYLNENADVVCVQHEYGIFGGPDGAFACELLRDLNVPSLLVPHTILSRPTKTQRDVLRSLARVATRVIAPTERGATFLVDCYEADAGKVDVIPHGAALSRRSPAPRKLSSLSEVRLGGYGLLSPGKGFETIVRAMPRIVAAFPNARATIAGATHPSVRARDGERYREFLFDEVRRQKMQGHVELLDRYLDDAEVTAFVDDLDVCLAPYGSFEQIVSGTVAFALGRGRPVVASDSWYSRDALARGRGRVVPAGDADALATATVSLLHDDGLRARMAGSAREWAARSGMDWPDVAHAYRASLERAHEDRRVVVAAGANPASRPIDVPPLRFDHIVRMSDDTGFLQHANWSVPNRLEGYTTDDNARSLWLVALSSDPLAAMLTTRYLAFVEHAFNRSAGRFRNVLGYDRIWKDKVGSDECHGRAMQALAALALRHDGIHAELARELFRAAVPEAFRLTSLRGMAFAALAADTFLTEETDAPAALLVEHVADALTAAFEEYAVDGWRWFEDRLTYFNAVLSSAAIVCGRRAVRPALLAAGFESLAWLCTVQTSSTGSFAPIGNQGWYARDGARAAFDQQPVDAFATVSACARAFEASGDERWIAEARRAYSWYFGQNDVGARLYDTRTGGCRDGLHVHGCNENQGAEAAITFWLASSIMARLQSRSHCKVELHEQEPDGELARS